VSNCYNAEKTWKYEYIFECEEMRRYVDNDRPDCIYFRFLITMGEMEENNNDYFPLFTFFPI
jgi:hypothetical protein